MQQSLLQEGTISTSLQADKESELKQLWIERWKEGGDKRKLVKGRGRKASRAFGEVETANYVGSPSSRDLF